MYKHYRIPYITYKGFPGAACELLHCHASTVCMPPHQGCPVNQVQRDYGPAGTCSTYLHKTWVRFDSLKELQPALKGKCYLSLCTAKHQAVRALIFPASLTPWASVQSSHLVSVKVTLRAVCCGTDRSVGRQSSAKQQISLGSSMLHMPGRHLLRYDKLDLQYSLGSS
jgi:hypothetical protein